MTFSSVAQCQDAGLPEVNPALVVRAAVQGTTPRLSRTVRQRTAPRADAVLPLRATRGECLEVVGYATGAARVAVEVVLRDVPVASEVVLTNSLAQVARGRFCAEVSTGYSLRVRAEGPAWWSLVVLPATAPQDAGTSVVRNASVPDAPAAPDAPAPGPAVVVPSVPIGGTEGDYVAGQIRSLARTRALGPALTAASRWTLETNGFREITAVVPSGSCVELVAAGVPSVGDLVLELYDPTGNRVAQDATHQGTESARFCPPYAGPYRGRVRVFAGAGLVAGQLLAAPATPRQ